MSSRVQRVPGPDHPIDVAPSKDHVVVRVADRVVADTRRSLRLQEASYPVVHYIPREDVDMSLLERTDHHTYCPYKGDASYYSIPSAGDRGTNAVWTYEHPYDSVASIANYLAFYGTRVDAFEVTPG